MIYGTTIFNGDGSTYYTPEFPRGGLSASFVARILNYQVVGATSVQFQLETRNAEDTTWTNVGSAGSANSVGTTEWEVSGGIKEICRVAMEFQGGTPAASDMIHFFMQAPSWRPY